MEGGGEARWGEEVNAGASRSWTNFINHSSISTFNLKVVKHYPAPPSLKRFSVVCQGAPGFLDRASPSECSGT